MTAHQLRLVLGFSLLRAAAGYLVAAPVVVAVAGSGVATFPGGDALLFDRDGFFLIEALRLSAGHLNAAVPVVIWSGLAALLGLLAALCLLMVALAQPEKLPRGEWARRAADCWPSFVLFAGLALLAQIVIVLLVLLASAVMLGTGLERSPRALDLAGTGAVLIGIAVIGGVGVLHDLTRAARIAVTDQPGSALKQALLVARHRPGRVAASYLPRLLASVAVVAAAALIVGKLGLERGGAGSLWLVLLAHQSAAFVWALLRAGWLRDAIGLVRLRLPQAPGDTPAGSVVPADPTPDPGA